MKRIIIFIVLAVIVVGGIIGYRMYSKQTPDIVQDAPDAVIKAKDLIAAFEKDTAGARKQYMDKVIEVTGNIKSVDTSGAVVLGEEGSASAVVVGLDRRHIKDAGQLRPGSEVVLQGVCSGYEISGGDPNDMIASLGGTTVQFRSAGVKNKK